MAFFVPWNVPLPLGTCICIGHQNWLCIMEWAHSTLECNEPSRASHCSIG
jgi:hypothetical protein